MREKLIELIKDALLIYGYDSHPQRKPDEFIANHLIANGVTIQRWIPVTERLPTEEDADDDGFMFAYTTEHKKIIARWTDVCIFSEFITHWVPLPEAPEGE